ncbi:MAG: glucose-6-phosphate 1-epimerase [Gammaproteobacteria bacterium]
MISVEATADDASQIVLALSTEDVRKEYQPSQFSLTLEVTVGKELSLSLTCRNDSESMFQISQALHSYFRISQLTEVAVTGLDETQYLDKCSNLQVKQQQGPLVFDREVDRIYQSVSHPTELSDRSLGRNIRINSRGSGSVVV